MIQEATPTPVNVRAFLNFASPFPGKTVYLIQQRRTSPWLAFLYRGHGYMAIEAPTHDAKPKECRFGTARVRTDSVLIRWDGNVSWTHYPISQYHISL